MIEIGFDEGVYVLGTPPEEDCEEYRRSPFDLTYFGFERPIHLRVDGVDLMADAEGTPAESTLVGFATALQHAVVLCAESGEADLDLPVPMLEPWGTVHLRLGPDGSVGLENGTTGVRVVVGLSDLQSAVARCADQVRTYLLGKCPNLIDDEAWGFWFRGEDRRWWCVD